MDNLTLKIGVMGYSAQQFDNATAQQMIEAAFDFIASNHPGRAISVVSGYTDLGIPHFAYAEAAKRGWKTVGVACSKAKEYAVYPCDEVQIVGTKWGDESPTFLAMCDVFVRVGGGNQSRREAQEARAQGKIVYEYELDSK